MCMGSAAEIAQSRICAHFVTLVTKRMVCRGKVPSALSINMGLTDRQPVVGWVIGSRTVRKEAVDS